MRLRRPSVLAPGLAAFLNDHFDAAGFLIGEFPVSFHGFPSPSRPAPVEEAALVTRAMALEAAPMVPVELVLGLLTEARRVVATVSGSPG